MRPLRLSTRPVSGAALGVAAVLAAVASPAPAYAAWAPPVPGGATRLFHLGRNPFLGGQHRGADLAAAPGEPVRAACGGPVRFAGHIAGAGTVSVTCGRWRVSYAPLERIAVRAGHRIGEGRRLGVVAGGSGPGHAGRRLAVPAAPRRAHAGLHFGVRLEGRRFGYVDPLPFLAGSRRAPPPLVPVPSRPRHPVARPGPAPHADRPGPALAPWTVWVGLALLMTGLAGAGTLRFPSRQTGGAACRASSTSSSSQTTPSRP